MIITVLGARPQFVKAAVVSKALSERKIDEFVVHTGQHYDERMSAVFWRELGLPGVAANLEVGSSAHGAQTGQMMQRLEDLILRGGGKFTGMLVYGDTNSTLAGVLVAAKLSLPVFHVEAGLRSFDRSMPEEVNRIVADHLSTLLFCPSEHARAQLASEGLRSGVHVVGDVMLDALQSFRAAASTAPTSALRWSQSVRRKVLITIHRPSNADDAHRMQKILDAIGKLPVDALWPVHPRVRSKLNALRVPENIEVHEPLTYLEMVRALDLTQVVITDSGGLQKEAYWSRRPCITLRANTEWVETVEAGWNTLVSEDLSSLARAVLSESRPDWTPLYGDGEASKRIADLIHAATA